MGTEWRRGMFLVYISVLGDMILVIAMATGHSRASTNRRSGSISHNRLGYYHYLYFFRASQMRRLVMAASAGPRVLSAMLRHLARRIFCRRFSRSLALSLAHIASNLFPQKIQIFPRQLIPVALIVLRGSSFF